MKKIAIMCELKERELQFLTILKKKLEVHDYKVKIIPQRIWCGFALLKFKPDIIIVNGLRSESSYISQIYIPKKLFNCKIISLYSEQIGRIDGIVDTYDNSTILNSIDAHVTWGELFANGLIELGVDRERVWVLGSMALDIPYFINEIINSRRRDIAEQYGLDYSKKWILVSDNIIRRGDQEDIYSELRKDFNDSIKELSTRLKNCEIIFRPHPDNKVSDLEGINSDFQMFNNIKIIKEEHSLLWTILSEVMIIWRSTSSIEAWSVGKEVFAMQTNDSRFDYWHESFVPNFRDRTKFATAIESYLNGNYTIDQKYIEARNEYMKNWFYKTDGKSFDRICSLVDIVNNSDDTIVPNQKIGNLKIIKNYLLELVNIVLKLLKGEYSKFDVTKEDILGSEKNILLDDTKIKMEKISTPSGNNLIEINSK